MAASEFRPKWGDSHPERQLKSCWISTVIVNVSNPVPLGNSPETAGGTNEYVGVGGQGRNRVRSGWYPNQQTLFKFRG